MIKKIEAYLEVAFRKNHLIYFLFIFSTLFFIYQHTTGLSWDFTAYVLNARYWFADGFYFEWLRPPLVPLTISALSIFGWLSAEYLYIIFVSLIFMVSSLKLAEKINFNKTAFYALLLTPFVLNVGLSVGTELLSLSLLQFFVLFLLKKKEIFSGASLSLLCLTHYTSIIFAPLLLFQKDFKKILISIIFFILFFSPWLAYNWYAKGSPLTSIADSYALNVKFREEYIFMPFNFFHLISIIGYYFPFLILGIYFRARKKFRATDLIMILVLILVLFSYARIPLKSSRFLFLSILASVYFTMFAIKRLKYFKTITLLFISINFILAYFIFIPLDSTNYKDLIPKLEGCMAESNAWLYFNYHGKPTATYPRKEMVSREIEKGNRVVLYRHIFEPEYIFEEEFLAQFQIIENTTEYIILGDPEKCAPEHAIDETYLEQLKKYGVEVSACEAIFPKSLCELISY